MIYLYHRQRSRKRIWVQPLNGSVIDAVCGSDFIDQSYFFFKRDRWSLIGLLLLVAKKRLLTNIVEVAFVERSINQFWWNMRSEKGKNLCEASMKRKVVTCGCWHVSFNGFTEHSLNKPVLKTYVRWKRKRRRNIWDSRLYFTQEAKILILSKNIIYPKTQNT